MNSKNKKKIIIVANDAGGAEILAAYILENKTRFVFVCFTAGPAAKIMKREGIASSNAPENRKSIMAILKKHQGAELVLTGTGWMTDKELNFISEAKRLGLHTASFLDHWVNYRERFGYPKPGWRNNLPSEIWVGDAAAFALAKKMFTGKKVRLLANPFWKRIHEISKKDKREEVAKDILFVSEPHIFINKVLNLVLEFLAMKNFRDKFIIRFHPAEKRDKYDRLIEKWEGRVLIFKSKEPNVWGDLKGAKTVIGMETMALVVGSLAGRKTISFIPSQFGKCSLPVKDIIKVKDVAGLGRAFGQV